VGHQIEGLAFDPATLTLYGTDRQGDRLVTIDSQTGSLDVIGAIGFAGVFGLAHATPVPIPAAAWLFGSALGLLGWMRRAR